MMVIRKECFSLDLIEATRSPMATVSLDPNGCYQPLVYDEFYRSLILGKLRKNEEG